MKKCVLSLVFSCLSIIMFAQVDSTTAPYKKVPFVPPFQILLGDSVTTYAKADLPKGKPLLLMLFSPECSHCQHEAEEMVANKNLLNDLQIVMVTFHPLWQMNEFVSAYKLKELPNLVVGRESYYMLPSFYAIHNLPFHALYNKDGELITAFEGSAELSKILDAFRKAK